jgi:polyisoprenoid-binding protein YceI
MKLIGLNAGRVTAVGTTQAISGHFVLDSTGSTPTLGENAFTVQLNTLTSNQKKRDDYLREVRDDGPSFDAYPEATFKATSMTRQLARGDAGSPGEGENLLYELAGTLTIRDITKRVSFDLKGRVAGDTLTGVGTTRVLLSDFGIGPIAFADILSVADPIEIEVVFTARAQP